MSTAGLCEDCDGSDYQCTGCGRLYTVYEMPIEETGTSAELTPVKAELDRLREAASAVLAQVPLDDYYYLLLTRAVDGGEDE